MKLLIDETLFKPIICALDYASGHDKRNASAYRSASDALIEAFIESAHNKFSIVEWHDINEEKPKDSTLILVKYGSGSVHADISRRDNEGNFCLGTFAVGGVTEWAYMPREKTKEK